MQRPGRVGCPEGGGQATVRRAVEVGGGCEQSP